MANGNNLNAADIVMQSHIRTFLQYGGSGPANPLTYYGQDNQWVVIEGVSSPESGGIEPVFVHDPNRPGKYKLIARKKSAPDLPGATIKFLEKRGAVPKQLTTIGCKFNAYQPSGACLDLSDFLSGWTDYVLIFAGMLVTDKDLGTRTSWSEDEMLEDSATVVMEAVYPAGAMSFGEFGAAQILREVMGVTYGSSVQCGECGSSDDGTKRIYSVAKSSGAGSPGLPAEVTYSLDGGLTSAEAQIDGIGASADPAGIWVVGSKLLVLVPSEGAYYWATLSTIGVPGSFTKVTTGFVANKNPNDVYVISPREVWFCGDGGYLYKSIDITAGVVAVNAGNTTTNDLHRISGIESTIVAVGESSTVIFSSTRGDTFATVTTSPSAIPVTIQALGVRSEHEWWVGTLNTGRVVWTNNKGETWNLKSFDGAGTGSVQDILWVTPEVGYFTYSTASNETARIFATINGGADFGYGKSRIVDFPTFTRANRLAAPNIDNPGLAANKLVIGGLAGNGTDGALFLASAQFI